MSKKLTEVSEISDANFKFGCREFSVCIWSFNPAIEDLEIAKISSMHLKNKENSLLILGIMFPKDG